MIIKVDPMDHPLTLGESWWVIHPNNAEAELCIPVGGPAVCTINFLDYFVKNSPYRIVSVDDGKGWIGVEAPDGIIVEMPRYIFARYFDVVAYVKTSLASVRSKPIEPNTNAQGHTFPAYIYSRLA